MSATMQLPEVKLKVTAQQCGEAKQPRLQDMIKPLLYQKEKEKAGIFQALAAVV